MDAHESTTYVVCAQAGLMLRSNGLISEGCRRVAVFYRSVVNRGAVEGIP
jgi:hypothetical protein